jgi:hypothetical protein
MKIVELEEKEGKKQTKKWLTSFNQWFLNYDSCGLFLITTAHIQQADRAVLRSGQKYYRVCRLY